MANSKRNRHKLDVSEPKGDLRYSTYAMLICICVGFGVFMWIKGGAVLSVIEGMFR